MLDRCHLAAGCLLLLGACSSDPAPPTDCVPSKSETCAKCGVRVCAVDGHWGECLSQGECEAGETKICEAGRLQVCGTKCSWGACGGSSGCTPGETKECGSCGKTTCQADGTWSACSGEGECTPAAVQQCGDGGTNTRTCSATCAWEPCQKTECTGGQTKPCGNCGTMTCSSAGVWGTCSNNGECSPKATMPCDNGSGTKTCSETCTWGACKCSPGAVRSCNGCCIQTCSATSAWGSCGNNGGKLWEKCPVPGDECGIHYCLASCAWSTSCVGSHDRCANGMACVNQGGAGKCVPCPVKCTSIANCNPVTEVCYNGCCLVK